MTSELGVKLGYILRREIGDMGHFILKKQCRSMELEMDDISLKDLPTLSEGIGRVLQSFGPETTKRVQEDISKLEQRPAAAA